MTTADTGEIDTIESQSRMTSKDQYADFINLLENFEVMFEQ